MPKPRIKLVSAPTMRIKRVLWPTAMTSSRENERAMPVTESPPISKPAAPRMAVSCMITFPESMIIPHTAPQLKRVSFFTMERMSKAALA